MGGAWPKDKDARRIIERLCKELGWVYDTDSIGSSAHGAGFLRCSDGCRVTVYSTPKTNQPRTLWAMARKCPHGHAPARPRP